MPPRKKAHVLDERKVAELLYQTLGEEEASDYLLTEISKPILQQARAEDLVGAKPARETVIRKR